MGSYITADGVTTYEESGSALYLDASGRLRMQYGNASLLRAEIPELWNLTDYARSLLERVTEPGDARLYLTGAATDGDTTTLTFDYFLSGVRIQQPAGSAAVFQFSGSALQRLELTLHSYTCTEESVALLPELQAAAIEPDGVKLAACYLDQGGESLILGWDMG